ncbi:ATP-binding protein [Thalassotalea agarivorans]|nr:ATP-binding protein [Thalassotalea agarivorans]
MTNFVDDVVYLQANQQDIELLEQYKKRFVRDGRMPPKALMKRLNPRAPTTVILEDDTSGQFRVFGNERVDKIIEFIEDRVLDTTNSYQFFHHRLTGPVVAKTPKRTFKLYLVKKTRPQTFAEKLFTLPMWARLLVPASISFVLCWLLARSLTKPLRSMQHATKQIGEGDLTSRVTGLDNRKDEIGELSKTFNTMAEKLSHNSAAQQRLLADVSHELRTPLTRLEIALSIVQQQNEHNKSNDYIERCKDEIARIDSMLNDILTLSKLENTVTELNKEALSTVNFIENHVDDASLLAQPKHIDVEIANNDVATINADYALLSSALSNVLSNAIKYSPDNSAIKVSSVVSGKALSITVSDQGPGVSEHLLAIMFEPFYRISEARERKTGGTGLGLAIAKQAVVAHKGKITAKNKPEAGLEVTIVLPLH